MVDITEDANWEKTSWKTRTHTHTHSSPSSKSFYHKPSEQAPATWSQTAAETTVWNGPQSSRFCLVDKDSHTIVPLVRRRCPIQESRGRPLKPFGPHGRAHVCRSGMYTNVSNLHKRIDPRGPRDVNPLVLSDWTTGPGPHLYRHYVITLKTW